MIRLERHDLEDKGMLSRLASEAKVRPAQFRERFGLAATLLKDGVPMID